MWSECCGSERGARSPADVGVADAASEVLDAAAAAGRASEVEVPHCGC